MNCLVEQRTDDPRTAPTLDALADALIRLGHQVTRWDNRQAPPPRRFQLGILWNGLHPLYDRIRGELSAAGTKLLVAELGWLSQDGTFQLDHAGINGLASWAGSLDVERTGHSVSVRPGPLLVCLQIDGDMQIEDRRLNPMFPGGMAGFLQFLAEHCDLGMIVRPHPLALRMSTEVQSLVDGCLRMHWGEAEGPLADAMSECCAVATINSTAGAEAMDAGMPVLGFGRSVWAVEGAAYVIRTPEDLRRAVDELREHECSLSEGAQQATLDRIRAHQWTLADLPARLQKYLDGLRMLQEVGYDH